MWPQPVDPLHSMALSAGVAALPLASLLVLMGGFRKSSLTASVCGLTSACILAVFVWRMPARLAFWSVMYGFAYAIAPILWIVFSALCLYHIAVESGSFDQLRRWI